MSQLLNKYSHIVFLGSNSGLSVAEFCEVFRCAPSVTLRFGDKMLVNIDSGHIKRKFWRLGGTVKIVELKAELPLKNFSLNDLVAKILEKIPNFSRKFLGISIYGSLNVSTHDVKLRISEAISRKRGQKVKVVGDIKQAVLNTASTNKILNKGGLQIDIVVFPERGKVLVGFVKEVQDIDLWSSLDYSRPERDMKVGMLPSKLARIMLNLAKIPKEEGGFWDPFCGLGTLIMQGQLLSYYSYGSDVNREVLQKAEKNVAWLKEIGLVSRLRYRLFKHDIKRNPLNNKILRDIARFGRFDAIVTEPYLGKPRSKPFATKKLAAAVWSSLRGLYKSSLRNSSYLINPGGRIVFVVPMFKVKGGLWYEPVPEINRHRWKIVNFNAGRLVWKRPNSIVARKIVVIEKL